MNLAELETYKLVIKEKLIPYTAVARQWWEDMENHTFNETTTYPIAGAPPGMFARCCRSPNQSCIPGIQAFPIVAPAYIQGWPRISGGVMATIEYIAKHGLVIEEFSLVPKRGLQTTLRNGFFLCYIPTRMLEREAVTRWVYMTKKEVELIACDVLPLSLKERIAPYAKNYYKGESQSN